MKILAIIVVLAIPTISAKGLTTLYVSPDGDNSWSGATPNRRDAQGPVHTLAHALEVVRARRKSAPGVPIEVSIASGVYPLEAPLRFTPDDSGTAAAPILFHGDPSNRPVISGGTRITGWKVGADGRWRVHLPDVQAGRWNFSQLWVNGVRRPRPRLPESGYYRTAGKVAPTSVAAGQAFDGFRFNPGEIRSTWSALHDVEVLPFHTWIMSRFRIAAVDETRRVVQLAGHSPGADGWGGLVPGSRYIVENVKEALGKPGQWYLDRASGELTYIPRPGEKPETAAVVAPRLTTLVELAGDPGRKAPVQYITFQNLAFADTEWTVPAGGQIFGQAEVNLPAAINAVGARHVTFRGCDILHTGAWAAAWGDGCHDDALLECILSDLGGGGVKIGGMNYIADPEKPAGGIVVRDCLIAGGGRVQPAATGIWIGHSAGNQIIHNEIRDFYYTGISVGWSWGYGPSGAHHNMLAYNRIRDIGQGVLSDLGGIYLLGLAPGTVVRGNSISDVFSFDYGGWGIYPDEGSTGLLIENNLVAHTKSAGFHQHYGKDNIVRNNIFAFGDEHQIMRTRAEDHLSFSMEHNIVLWRNGDLLGSNWTGPGYAIDYNDYWHEGGGQVTFAGESLEQWNHEGRDTHSLIADPGFVDANAGNFDLKPGSPAYALGFKPFDYRAAGRSYNLRRQPEHPAPPTFPATTGERPISDSFENEEPGQKPMGWVVNEESEAATARVSADTAAAGKQSLKIIEAAGQKFSYSPHIYFEPQMNEGRAVDHFAVRLGPGAQFYHEWRDTSTPYRRGPSIYFKEDGTIVANGRTVARAPIGAWFTVDITCDLGAAASGTYDLHITLPERVPPMDLPRIPYDPGFRQLRWLGFISDKKGPGVFYLDDVRLSHQDR